jgi:hypothetical protein
MLADYSRRSIMTQTTCGICGKLPDNHDHDQLQKCLSDAGFDVKFTTADALLIGREFSVIKRYSPPDKKGIARISFQDEPELFNPTEDLAGDVFKKALPNLKKLKKTGLFGLGGKEVEAFDDDTLERMEGMPEPEEEEEDIPFDDETIEKWGDEKDTSEG